MNEKIVKLKFSIPIPKEGGGSMDVNELKIGRLKAKHLRALPNNFMERKGELEPAELIPLIASLTDIPEASADEIDLEDLTAFAENLESFLAASLRTGKK